MNAEQIRLEEARTGTVPWKRWGPYLSERQWGTVREDLSESGDAWNSFSHDDARSRQHEGDQMRVVLLHDVSVIRDDSGAQFAGHRPSTCRAARTSSGTTATSSPQAEPSPSGPIT